MPCHASPIMIASIVESIGCFSSDLRVFMTPGPGRVDPYGGLESTNICAIPACYDLYRFTGTSTAS